VERGGNTGTPIEADPLILSAGMSHRAVTECILALAGQSGYKAAVIDAVDGTVTAWPRFGWTIRAAAHGLSRRGLAAGDTAGVFVQDAASFAVAVNAIRAAGATALPIRPDAGVADVTARLNAGGVRLLITSAPLAGLAAEAADRSRVRQVFAFGEAAGTTPFRSLLAVPKHGADTRRAGTGEADTDGAGRPEGAAGRPEGAAGRPEGAAGRAGLCRRDVVVAGPPCGDGYAYTSLLDLILLTGATIVAAPVPLVTAAMRVYKGTAAIVPCGTTVPGLPPDRVFTVALPRSSGGSVGSEPPRQTSEGSSPMPDEPKHPLSALTTYELRDYRRQLERAIKGIAPDAPVQADLRRKLDEVLAEQDHRATIASRP
jgi:AMP-binding enzyme